MSVSKIQRILYKSASCFIHPTAELPDVGYIGDHVYIGENVKILTPSIEIMDYTRIHQNTFINGTRPFSIGYNCWVGGHCILDTRGGLVLGNNIGIGAHSQLWTHMRFGDTLQGCRFDTEKPLIVEDDVWFVGHCIVSPIKAEKRSMALVGSVVTKDMSTNHVYAGVPAKDITDNFGPQFKVKTDDEIKEHFDGLVYRFCKEKKKTSKQHEELLKLFNPVGRTYIKNYKQRDAGGIVFISIQEEFLLWCYPLAKFIPVADIRI